MTTIFIDKLCEQYGITKTEFLCIVTNFQVENQTFSYAETIAKGRKLKFLSQSAKQFFYRDDVKKFIAEQKTFFAGGYMGEFDGKEEDQTIKNKDSNQPKENLNLFGPGMELTKDNIKQVLEYELSKTTDPEKRTALLIRVADFLSLNDSGTIDFDKPIIYLPDRVAITA